jgi:hypothetical protein
VLGDVPEAGRDLDHLDAVLLADPVEEVRRRHGAHDLPRKLAPPEQVDEQDGEEVVRGEDVPEPVDEPETGAVAVGGQAERGAPGGDRLGEGPQRLGEGSGELPPKSGSR